MNLKIILPKYDRCTVSLSVDKLPEGCMFKTVLEMDPTATEIELSVECMTPDVLHGLEQILVHDTLPKKISSKFSSAGRYLGIDFLTVLGDPLYPAYIRATGSDLLHMEDGEVQIALEYAVKHAYHSLFVYLYSRCTDRACLLSLSIKNKDEFLVRFIIQQGIDVAAVPVCEGMAHNLFYQYILPILDQAISSTLPIFKLVHAQLDPGVRYVDQSFSYLMFTTMRSALQACRNDIVCFMLPLCTGVRIPHSVVMDIVEYGDVSVLKVLPKIVDLRDMAEDIMYRLIMHDQHKTDLDRLKEGYPYDNLEDIGLKYQFLAELYPSDVADLMVTIFREAYEGTFDLDRMSYPTQVIPLVLMIAIQRGHSHIVENLLEHIPTDDIEQYVTRDACYGGKMLQILSRSCDLHTVDLWNARMCAAHRGYTSDTIISTRFSE